MARYRLTLHCGLHKTGTTALQKVLHRNRGALAARGVFYPSPPEGVGHNRFFRPALAHELQHALEAFFVSGTERLLLSAEDLSHHLLDPARTRAIREIFARLFDIEIIVYLRRQDRLKESVYAEIAKRRFTGPIAADTHYMLDFRERLARLEAAFGRDALTVRLYPEDAPCPTILLSDFCAATGLDPAAMETDGTRHNAAFHRRKTLLLSEMPVGGGPSGREFIRFLGSSAVPDDDGIRFLGAPDTHRAILETYRAGNDAVAARYRMPDPIPTFEMTEEHAAWRPPAAITEAERKAVLHAFVAAD
jgi:hypothetical protein